MHKSVGQCEPDTATESPNRTGSQFQSSCLPLPPNRHAWPPQLQAFSFEDSGFCA